MLTSADKDDRGPWLRHKAVTLPGLPPCGSDWPCRLAGPVSIVLPLFNRYMHRVSGKDDKMTLLCSVTSMIKIDQS
jgi:hypothetical protein